MKLSVLICFKSQMNHLSLT